MKPTTIVKKKPRLVLAMDSQALQALGRCDREYYQGHVEHLQKIRLPKRLDGEPIAVNTGQLIHTIMNQVNRLKIAKASGRFPKFTVASQQLLEAGYRVISRAKDLTPEQKQFHTVKFTQFFAWDLNEGKYFKPMGTEVGFSKVIYEDADKVFLYEGRIDLVLRAELSGAEKHFETWLDYKSTGRDSVMYMNRNQFLGYSWVLGSNMGFVLSYGLQKEKKDPFKYKAVYHPQPLIEQWRADTIESFKFVFSRIELGKQFFPRNRAACDSREFGWCPFLALCDNEHAPVDVQNGLRRIFYRKRIWSPWD